LGRYHEALDQVASAVEQDPLNVLFRGVFALILGLESPDRSLAEARTAMELDATHWLPYYAISLYHFRRGELPLALQFAERSLRGPLALPAGLSAGLLRRLGQNDRADELLSRLTAPNGRFIYHILCADLDAAADALERSLTEGTVQSLMWLPYFLEPLRATPRWPALAKMMNLPPEAV
jgi:hypothetical protein